MAIKLQNVKDIEHYGGFLKSSPKITLYLDSSNMSSKSSTPGTQTPARVPDTNTAPSQITWVCPICYYSNSLSRDYEHGISELPACLTCGIKATSELIEQSMKAAETSSSSQVQKSNNNSGFQCPRCTFNNHPLLTQCEMCGAALISPRLPPKLATIRSDSPGPAALLVPNGDAGQTKLSFRGNGDKAFYDQLKKTLSSRPWENGITDNTDSDGKPLPSTKTGPGLHGLERIGERDKQQTQEVLGSALEDLQTLMDQAKDVVQLAEKYAKHLEKEEQKSSTATTADVSARKALRESSEALGLNSSVVTKEMAGKQENYHSELARQIAEFLENGGILRREGGVISLVDLFAIYNRARGISLISPKDLYSACEQMEKLNLPIRLRKFKSGLIVVQESYKTPQVIIKQLLSWLKKLEPWQSEIGVSAQDASQKFGWSVTVAVEELEMAEQYGALCRDEQLSGVRFFENLILPYTG